MIQQVTLRTNHISLYFDQSQRSLFWPVTIRDNKQIAMTLLHKRHFRSGCHHGNIMRRSSTFLPPKYFAVNKDFFTNMYVRTMPQNDIFQNLYFSIFGGCGPQIWAQAALSPFFICILLHRA